MRPRSVQRSVYDVSSSTALPPQTSRVASAGFSVSSGTTSSSGLFPPQTSRVASAGLNAGVVVPPADAPPPVPPVGVGFSVGVPCSGVVGVLFSGVFSVVGVLVFSEGVGVLSDSVGVSVGVLFSGVVGSGVVGVLFSGVFSVVGVLVFSEGAGVILSIFAGPDHPLDVPLET
ncbi:hypothetical protein H6768_04695 [Candidatus Peribacteria bacterium]|nr:hypothetical protein [Candidatus Peribacteria bacterium]